MFTSYGKDTRTDRERYLQDELDREREANERRERQLDEDRERAHKERKEEREREYRYASSWPDAFQKQATLCWREHNKAEEQFVGDDYFYELAHANEKALEIWLDVATRKQLEIDVIFESLRNEVAERLEAESERPEYKQTAQSIRDDALFGYLDW